jgi:endonuclease III
MVASSEQKAVAAELLRRHGRTYAEDLGIRLARGTPSPLFRWLCASLLLSARIRADVALEAARALFRQGWRTAQRLEQTSWEERTRVLNKAGYARYDESTSRMLGDTTALLLERYKGDLRRLRDAADREPAKERLLLKELKGIGDVGADIFLREVQGTWDELFPFVDRRSLAGAEKVGLPASGKALAELVRRRDFPRLAAALVRVDLGAELD